MPRRLSVAAHAAVIAICAAFSAPAQAQATAAGPRVGERVPAFHLYDTAGSLVALRDHVAFPDQRAPLQPKSVVVIDFFRTDCKPCRASLPHLIALHKKLRARNVLVLLVALLEEEEGETKLDAFLKKAALPFPVLVDTYGVVAKKYVRKGEGYQIPQLFVLDRQARLKARQGALDAKAQATLQRLIEGLLK